MTIDGLVKSRCRTIFKLPLSTVATSHLPTRKDLKNAQHQTLICHLYQYLPTTKNYCLNTHFIISGIRVSFNFNQKSPGDPRKLVVTQTPVKYHKLMLVWKTCKVKETKQLISLPLVLPPTPCINVYDSFLYLSFHHSFPKDGSSWSRKYLGKIQCLPKFLSSRSQMIHMKTWMDQKENRQTQSVCPA